MSFLFNNKKINNVNFNGKPVKKIVFNGKTVWENNEKYYTLFFYTIENNYNNSVFSLKSSNCDLKWVYDWEDESNTKEWSCKIKAGQSFKIIFNVNTNQLTDSMYVSTTGNFEKTQYYTVGSGVQEFVLEGVMPEQDVSQTIIATCYNESISYSISSNVYGHSGSLAYADISCTHPNSETEGSYVDGYVIGPLYFYHDAIGIGAYKCIITLYIDGVQIGSDHEYPRGADEAIHEVYIPFDFTMPSHDVEIEVNIQWK